MVDQQQVETAIAKAAPKIKRLDWLDENPDAPLPALYFALASTQVVGRASSSLSSSYSSSNTKAESEDEDEKEDEEDLRIAPRNTRFSDLCTNVYFADGKALNQDAVRYATEETNA
ncbi:MAG TPA: hypothetical protein VGI88_05725 [Verrucomicrobiae bacterium]|jgi:hypothetical protein